MQKGPVAMALVVGTIFVAVFLILAPDVVIRFLADVGGGVAGEALKTPVRRSHVYPRGGMGISARRQALAKATSETPSSAATVRVGRSQTNS